MARPGSSSVAFSISMPARRARSIRGEGGGERVVEQRVRYDRREAANEEEKREFAERARAIRTALQARTLETELSVRARERPAPQGKDVEVEIDDAATLE